MKRLLAMILTFVLLLAGCGEPAQPAQTTESPQPTETADTTPATAPDLNAPVEHDGTPAADAIALVANGDTVTAVASVPELVDSISPDGCTRVRLLQDISQDKPISLPYSCVFDFDGHSVATNPDRGSGLTVVAAGSVNPVTILKNGKLVSNSATVRLTSGGIVLEKMHLQSLEGICLALYETGPYKDTNRVTDSVLISGGDAAVSFEQADGDFTGTGVSFENTRLVNCDPDGGYLFLSAAERRKAGAYHLGENVELYSYAETAIPEDYLYFSGKLAHRTQLADLTVDGTTYPQIRGWSTAASQERENLLFIGNSFCYYFVQELFGMADTDGRQINVMNLYEAGCRIDEHWTWLNDPVEGADKYELWITNDMGRFIQADTRTINAALAYADWDKITVQQHFTPGKAKTVETAIESCTPYAKNMFDYLKTNHPGAELYWHEHWAFQIGHDTVPDVETQTRQYDNLRAACIAISDENQVTMIPGGDAWQLARADSLFGDTLCKSDNIHDDTVGGGQYLNACVWYETLFRTSCLGNEWRPEYRLSESKIQVLQAYAHQAVSAYHGSDFYQ